MLKIKFIQEHQKMEQYNNVFNLLLISIVLENPILSSVFPALINKNASENNIPHWISENLAKDNQVETHKFLQAQSMIYGLALHQSVTKSHFGLIAQKVFYKGLNNNYNQVILYAIILVKCYSKMHLKPKRNHIQQE
jgi:hypothetical protein